MARKRPIPRTKQLSMKKCASTSASRKLRSRPPHDLTIVPTNDDISVCRSKAIMARHAQLGNSEVRRFFKSRNKEPAAANPADSCLPSTSKETCVDNGLIVSDIASSVEQVLERESAAHVSNGSDTTGPESAECGTSVVPGSAATGIHEMMDNLENEITTNVDPQSRVQSEVLRKSLRRRRVVANKKSLTKSLVVETRRLSIDVSDEEICSVSSAKKQADEDKIVNQGGRPPSVRRRLNIENFSGNANDVGRTSRASSEPDVPATTIIDPYSITSVLEFWAEDLKHIDTLELTTIITENPPENQIRNNDSYSVTRTAVINDSTLRKVVNVVSPHSGTGLINASSFVVNGYVSISDEPIISQSDNDFPAAPQPDAHSPLDRAVASYSDEQGGVLHDNSEANYVQESLATTSVIDRNCDFATTVDQSYRNRRSSIDQYVGSCEALQRVLETARLKPHFVDLLWDIAKELGESETDGRNNCSNEGEPNAETSTRSGAG